MKNNNLKDNRNHTPCTIFFCGVLLFCTPFVTGATEKTIFIKGGSISGIYYKAADEMCNTINQHSDKHLDCRARGGPGSTFNIQAVQRDILDFGITQADRLWEAWHGQGEWNSANKTTDIRSILSLHTETVLVVTLQNKKIKKVEDLIGKRVNIGNHGSGHRTNALDILKAYEIELSALETYGFQQNHATDALLEGAIDAFVYTAGNPTPAITRVANAVDMVVLPLNSPKIINFVANHPQYVTTNLPASAYTGVDKDIPTIGTKAILITNEHTSEENVYWLVKTLFENLDEFREKHPAFEELTPENMLSNLIAPLHPGAKKYYMEQGWIKE